MTGLCHAASFQSIVHCSIYDATSACRAARGHCIVVVPDVLDVTSACYAASPSYSIVTVTVSVGVGNVGRPVIAIIGKIGRRRPSGISRVVGVGSTGSYKAARELVAWSRSSIALPHVPTAGALDDGIFAMIRGAFIPRFITNHLT